MKLCLIGFGMMGSTILKGILQGGLFSQEKIIVCDIDSKINQRKSSTSNVEIITDNKRGADMADIILLAVKPQQIDVVLEEIKCVTAGKLVISIAAGISNDYLVENLADTVRTVRVMPNMPAFVNQGISVICPGKNIYDNDLDCVKKIFSNVGEVVQLDEKLMDAVTALSGSGPAFIYLIIEALADGGVLAGISRDLALKLSIWTVLGSAKMLLDTGKHPAQLKDMVTSPAGTTIEGLKVLEKAGIRGSIIEAVKEATIRAETLNNE